METIKEVNEERKGPKRKVALEMVIKSASCFIQQDGDLKVKWERGTKNITTKKKSIDKQITSVVFNEKFKMNGTFDFNENRQCFESSLTSLTLFVTNKEIGSVTIDLASYINMQPKTERATIGTSKKPNSV